VSETVRPETAGGTPPLRFDGQVAIVTGGSTGLGRSYVRELARRGAVVVSASRAEKDRDGGAARPHLDDDPAGRGRVEIVAVDVTDEAQATRLVADVVARHGRLDVLVNNAGTAWVAPIQDGSTEQLRAMIEVHLMGTFWAMRAALPHMRARRTGRIVNSASGVALFGRTGSFAYAAAKGAVQSMTRCAALDNVDVDVKVNAISPIAATPMAPSFESIDPLLDAERMSVSRVAPVVAYLAHPTCTLSGRVLHAAGGRVARAEPVLSRGWGSETLTPEDVADHVAEIDDLTGALVLDDSLDQYTHIPRGGSDFAQWAGAD
jgi:NAD(P)-dependent dehydrogenase (short-subunit alcohol dehydrogenase family)